MSETFNVRLVFKSGETLDITNIVGYVVDQNLDGTFKIIRLDASDVIRIDPTSVALVHIERD